MTYDPYSYEAFQSRTGKADSPVILARCSYNRTMKHDHTEILPNLDAQVWVK